MAEAIHNALNVRIMRGNNPSEQKSHFISNKFAEYVCQCKR